MVHIPIDAHVEHALLFTRKHENSVTQYLL